MKNELNFRRFDWHLHSHFSDGDLSPSQLIKECKKNGLKYVALTDHNVIGGIPAAIKEGNKIGINVITNCSAEFTCHYEEKTQHVLGYFMDPENTRLNSFLSSQKKIGIAYNREIVEILKKCGFKISLKKIYDANHGKIENSHFWEAIHNNKANRRILKILQIKSKRGFNKKFLKDDPCGIKKEKPTIKRTINMINKADGIAVLAHPFWKRTTLLEIEKQITEFQKLGLKGIEVCYCRHTQEQALSLHEIAKANFLYETIGSDFHGFRKAEPGRIIGKAHTYGIKLNLPFRHRDD